MSKKRGNRKEQAAGPTGTTDSGHQMRCSRGWLVAFALLLSAGLAGPAAGADDRAGAKLFDSGKPLDVVLQLPWQAIVTDEFFYQGGYPSELEYSDEAGKQISFAMETERRGKSRQVICRYPPIKLRFNKSVVNGTLFEGQKSLKLVTHCNKGARFEQYQVLEALAYRMYNIVTDVSFRIRPLSVTYVDSDSGKKDGPRFAFLVEDDGALARRNGLKKLKVPALSAEQMEPEEASKLALFQYMIGNTAWSLSPSASGGNCCDNLELLKRDSGQGQVYAVPNDFDSSGLVNAPYATPAAGIQAGNVRERVFLGSCAHKATLEQARLLFLEKQAAIRAMVENEPFLNDESRSSTLAFLDPFFEILADPAQFEARVSSHCRP